jgi:hypothetical protein
MQRSQLSSSQAAARAVPQATKGAAAAAHTAGAAVAGRISGNVGLLTRAPVHHQYIKVLELEITGTWRVGTLLVLPCVLWQRNCQCRCAQRRNSRVAAPSLPTTISFAEMKEAVAARKHAILRHVTELLDPTWGHTAKSMMAVATATTTAAAAAAPTPLPSTY